MASGTRQITALGNVFDFTTTRPGTISFFSNDLNISFNCLVTPTAGPDLRLHAGPILFLASFQCGAGCRVQLAAVTLGSAFPPVPQSLCQLQTDTIPQTPTLLELAPLPS